LTAIDEAIDDFEFEQALTLLSDLGPGGTGLLKVQKAVRE
jgi:hypothetical protein